MLQGAGPVASFAAPPEVLSCCTSVGQQACGDGGRSLGTR